MKILREVLDLTGTKEGCSEGDCGACTIALGALQGNRVAYRAVTSCILPAAKLHRKHVITIEGLEQGSLHPLQQAILEEHATQCGFCTPGVIMSLFCLFAANPTPESNEIDSALEGNLCRCTGYISIKRAALKVSDALKNKLCSLAGDILPPYADKAAKALSRMKPWPDYQKSTDRGRIESYLLPQSPAQLFAILKRFKSCDEYRLISGGTDVMVDLNIKGIYPRHLVDISRIPGWQSIKLVGGNLRLGSAVTLAQVAESPLVRKKLPVLAETVMQMASAQIRNLATLSGNLANASPIADAGVLLLALGAKVNLASAKSGRSVSIDEFYRSYRKTCLRPGEAITSLDIPLDGARAGFQKSAKRRAVDIATANSAVKIMFSKDRVKMARIALGGVAPTPILARRAAEYLVGRALDQETINKAAALAASECSPISDVRGGADFRKTLVENQVARHLRNIANLNPNPLASRQGKAGG